MQFSQVEPIADERSAYQSLSMALTPLSPLGTSCAEYVRALLSGAGTAIFVSYNTTVENVEKTG